MVLYGGCGLLNFQNVSRGAMEMDFMGNYAFNIPLKSLQCFNRLGKHLIIHIYNNHKSLIGQISVMMSNES